MRTKRIGTLALLACLAAPAAAQAQALPRGDAGGSIGWFHAREPGLPTNDEWYSQSAFLGAGAGWYWTPHLKTEVEGGVTSTGRLYAYQQLTVDGRPVFISGHYEFDTHRFAVSQLYQFRDNRWVHPFLGAGLDYTVARRRLPADDLYVYEPASGPRPGLPDDFLGANKTDHRLRPFALAGLKAYFSERVFFRSDARLTFARGLDEVVLRVGLGVDF